MCVCIYISIYRRDETRGEPKPMAPLSNTFEEQNVGGEWRFQRNLFSLRTVWRHLPNSGLFRSSLPLCCSPCASEMGGYLGMGWVSLLLSVWVEKSTFSHLIPGPGALASWVIACAGLCWRSCLQFSLAGKLFLKIAGPKAVVFFTFCTNWALCKGLPECN